MTIGLSQNKREYDFMKIISMKIVNLISTRMKTKEGKYYNLTDKIMKNFNIL